MNSPILASLSTSLDAAFPPPQVLGEIWLTGIVINDSDIFSPFLLLPSLSPLVSFLPFMLQSDEVIVPQSQRYEASWVFFRTSLRFKKTDKMSRIYRGFIEKVRLFSNRSEVIVFLDCFS